MPLAGELTAELQHRIKPDALRRLNVLAKTEGNAHPDSVIEDAIFAWTLPGTGYESFLGYLETQFLRPTNSDRQAYNGLYLWFIEHVYKALFLRHRDRAAQIETGLRFLDGIVGLANDNNPLWVFSLNHDLLVECLATSANVPVSCGFTSKSDLPRRDGQGNICGRLPIETVTREELASGRAHFFSAGVYGINLLKIHGGLDVFVRDDSNEMLRILPLSPGPLGLVESLVSVNEEIYYPEAHKKGKRVTNGIAYLDEKNELQIMWRSLLAGAFKFDKRYPKDLPDVYLTLFEQYLGRVSRLICIGYGFGDLHINEIIRGWLESLSNHIIEIVSPGIASTPDSIAHVSPQVVLVDSTATSYLERYSPKPLSLFERLLKSGLCAFHAAADRAYK